MGRNIEPCISKQAVRAPGTDAPGCTLKKRSRDLYSRYARLGYSNCRLAVNANQDEDNNRPRRQVEFGRGRTERKSIDRGGQHLGSSKMDER